MKAAKTLFLLLLVVNIINFPLLGAQDQTEDIEAIILGMPLEHKVAQMFMVNLYGSELTYAGSEMLEQWQPGAVVLVDTNIGSPEAITRLTNNYQETIIAAGGVPLFVAVDQEGGIIQRLRDGFTIWPVPMLYAAVDDEELVQGAGQSMAAELRAVGVNMNLAPVADLYTNLNNPIIGRRSAGNNADVVADMLNNFVIGLQSGGVLATLKHFPGHGDTSGDSHIELPELPLTIERLNAVELVPFEGGVIGGVGAIMTGHLWMSAIDPDPIPASLSHAVVTGLLRENIGYDGIIITDALDMDSIDTHYSPEEAALAAVMAGNDMVLIGAHTGEQIQARAMQGIVDAVLDGRISEAQIDASLRRILTAKARLGVLAWAPLDPFSAPDRIQAAQSSEIIRALFQAGITIAADKNNLLTQIPQSRVGLIYPGSRPRILESCNLQDGIQWLSVSETPTQDEINIAQTLANSVDINVIFTTNAVDNPAQQQLVNVLPPDRTLVIALASPFDISSFPDLSTYLLTYSPLDPAPEVACQVIFGQIEARGRLPIILSDAN